MYKALIAGSVAAATFVSYCVFFDHKRRSAPHYKQKLREKRRAQRLASQVTNIYKYWEIKEFIKETNHWEGGKEVEKQRDWDWEKGNGCNEQLIASYYFSHVFGSNTYLLQKIYYGSRSFLIPLH